MAPAVDQVHDESAAVAARPVAARLLSATVYAALLALLPLTALPYGAVEAWWTAAAAGLIFLLAALWAVEGALSGGWFKRAHLLVAPWLALSLFALLQSVPFSASQPISFDPYETRLVAARLLAVTLYGALLIRYAEGERRLRALVYTVIAVAVASALFGIARQATQGVHRGFLLPNLMPGTGYAQFINQNHFAYLMEAALGLALGLVAGRGVAGQRALVPLALVLPVWAALIFSNSRGGVLAMLCQAAFLGATFHLTRRRVEQRAKSPDPLRRIAASTAARGVLILLLLVLIVVGVAWVGGDPLADRFGSVGREMTAADDDSLRGGRPDIWAATWEMFKEHPLTGTGLGAYWVAISGYHKGSGAAVPEQAHNDYLELLASGGVVGFLALPAFLYLLVRRARVRLLRGSAFARAAALGALTGLFGIAVHSLVEFGLHVTVNALVAAALVALVAAESDPVDQKTNRSNY